MKKIFLSLLCIIPLMFFVWVLAADSFSLPKIFLFNHEGALSEWQEKVFKDQVLYTVESLPDGGQLAAKSDQACSGLIYKIKFNIHELPMMSWNWKVTKFPTKTDTTDESGSWVEKDDYAARVYVIFPSWNFMNIKTIEYIWDEDRPEGTVLTSPYFKNIKLIVVESGKSNMNEWVFEERNIYADYKKAFNKKPPKYAGAIALMTDSDNTLSTAEALYKDIKVGYDEPK